MNQKMFLTIKLVASLGLLVGLGWYFFRRQDISTRDIFLALHNFGPKTIAVSALLIALQNFFMALRIWSLFPKTGRISLGAAIHGVFYGQTINTFFPARAGDVLKIVIFSRSQGSAATTATGVIISDKVVDLFALVVLILLSRSFLIGNLNWSIPISTKGIALAVATLFLVLFLVRFALLKRMKKLELWWSGFKTGLLGVLEFKKTALAFFVGIAVWSCEVFTLQCLCEAQHFPISFSQGVFLLSVLNLAIAIPFSMANLGPFEAAIVFALVKLGASNSMALALAATYHLLQMAILLGLTGLVALFKSLRY